MRKKLLGVQRKISEVEMVSAAYSCVSILCACVHMCTYVCIAVCTMYVV